MERQAREAQKRAQTKQRNSRHADWRATSTREPGTAHGVEAEVDLCYLWCLVPIQHSDHMAHVPVYRSIAGYDSGSGNLRATLAKSRRNHDLPPRT